MAFKRGAWRCAVKGCAEDADTAVMIVMATPGNRRERVKRASKTVRLCMGDLKEMVAFLQPESLQAEAIEVMRKVTGVTWQPKPKRTK